MAGRRPPIQSVIRVEAGGGPARALEGCVTASTRVAGTRWLALHALTYTLPKDGAAGAPPRTWDAVQRTTRGAAAAADAAVVVATLRLAAGGGDDPRVLLVKQFRPPVGRVTVELPAGLVDAGEAPAEAALRELREETGFVGRAVAVSRPQCLSPGMSGEAVVVVRVDVEGQAAARALEDAEDIQVVSVPLRRLTEALDWMEKEEGCLVMHALAMLALGLELGAGHR
jgi:8-oxo-dGTP pyrophosphatase MutT (NUDIX family)